MKIYIVIFEPFIAQVKELIQPERKSSLYFYKIQREGEDKNKYINK